ncbi:hypothetical protein JYU34_018417 [Plutella xylostella]|uniref:Lariat debranching enzyme C-terminal domain-containing protein n=1 Tax=Plutella xylostella TaxID=51655 RepID=A0ABQ7PXI8_PLUXY|nr:hypothetical protein JYU34_018417 [Plutella xylostella]
MKIAIEGCAHGELEKIYGCIRLLQKRRSFELDLLICCGDFQATRNTDDLSGMAVPDRYKHMRTFYKYYSGELLAPVLTVFIGGNHEASSHMQELPYGGWVAPRIYYMGRSGVVRFGNLRIGGLSGIYKGHDYDRGLHECPPYNPASIRSVFHVRSLDVFRLSQVKEKVHVMLSHDWPNGITDYGNKNALLRMKPFFRQDIESNRQGSNPAMELLSLLKPDYWFSAHLHVKFAAVVPHADGTSTRFLALDKCLPRRMHLQVLTLPEQLDGDKLLKYDPEWLAVLKQTNHLLSVTNTNCYLPGPGGNERFNFTPTDEEKQEVKTIMTSLTNSPVKEIKLEIFTRNVPVYNPRQARGTQRGPVINPQTVKLCEALSIDDPVQVIMGRTGREMLPPWDDNRAGPSSSFEPVAGPSTPVVSSTPNRSLSLILPAPVQPSETETIVIDTTPRSSGLFEEVAGQREINTPCTQSNARSEPAASYVERPKDSEESGNSSVVSTPQVSGRRTFKRRNEAFYTTHDQHGELGGSMDSPF